VFRYYLSVQLVKLYEVWPSQHKVVEQFGAFVLFFHQEQGLPVLECGSFLKGTLNEPETDAPALQAVVLVLLCDAYDDDTLVQAVVEDAFDLLVGAFIKEN
jgi:hypothetical protein